MTANPVDAGATCPSCGEPIEVGDSFCEACGTELARPDPLGAADALVKFALDAGGTDNITVVLAPFPPASAAQARFPLNHRGPFPSGDQRP